MSCSVSPSLFSELDLRDAIRRRMLVVCTACNHWDRAYTHVGLTTAEAPHLVRTLGGRFCRYVPDRWGRSGGSTQPAEIAEIYARCERVAARFNARLLRLTATASSFGAGDVVP